MIASALEIPRLGSPRHCPRSLKVHGSDSGVMARAAVALIDAGIMVDTPRGTGTGADVVYRGLQAWLDKQCQGMHVFDFALHLAEVDDLDDVSYGTRVPPRRVVGHHLDIELNTASGYWGKWIAIGGGVTRLEKAAPGLGETALWWLNEVSCVMPLFTPRDALHQAQWTYWSGCEDESEVLAMYNDEGEDPDQYEGLTAKEFHDAIPKIAVDPQRRLRREKLSEIAGYHSSPRNRTERVATRLLVLDALYVDKGGVWPNRLPINDTNEVIQRAAALRWSAKDPMYRIADDYTHQASESGEFEECFSRVAIADPGRKASRDELQDCVHAWRDHLSHLARVFTVLRTADALIVELGSYK